MAFQDLAELIDAENENDTSIKAANEPRPCLLIVDDEEDICKALQILLGERYELLLCNSAESALEVLSPNVCTAILDVRLPGQHGFWLCDQIRQKYPDMPVIFFSAYQDVKNPFDIINQHRPFAYIMKGSDVDLLVRSIDLAVSLYQSLLQSRRPS